MLLSGKPIDNIVEPIVKGIQAMAQTAKAKMRASVELDKSVRQFTTKQNTELNKLVNFEKQVGVLKDKPEQVSANRSMIRRAVDDAAMISQDVDIFTSLQALKAEPNDKVKKDMQELTTKVNRLIEAFLAERGYL